MGTPAEPFLVKGDRVFHRGLEKHGTVQYVKRHLDVDRVAVRLDSGQLLTDVAAPELSKVK